MRGLNTLFLEKKDGFLHRYVIDEAGKLSQGVILPGVYDLDFVPSKDDPNIANLHKANPKIDAGEPLIRAYWLPWKSGDAREIELGSAAKYFFTSYLGGCRLQIAPVGSKLKILRPWRQTVKR
jgi:hypothetical protein